MTLTTTPTYPKIIPAYTLHLLAWTFLIGIEMLSIYLTYRRPISDPYFIAYYAVNVLTFYTMIRQMKNLAGRSRWYQLRQLTFVLLTLAAAVMVKSAIDYYRGTGTPEQRLSAAQRFLFVNFTRSLYFLTLAVFYRVAGYLTQYRKQAAEAKSAYLQQQLQPHMLFNALNFIYNKVDQHSDQAARCVWLLAELMRFTIRPAEPRQLVSVNEEITQLRHLVELNQLRFDQRLNINVHLEEPYGSSQIIPLILLTLSENIFKHGDLEQPDKPAELTLYQEENKLHFHSFNYKKPPTGQTRLRQLGLQHVRTRLDHIYGKYYRLDILQDEQTFTLDLELPC